ncbi:MAG: glycoside-pentoside-hexuronide (GPH):cation symporter [Lachnospiraceae bacterium]|nr:glycoside-pentoside-hexuronide (GPH):cation symporter [Lachnospiraceae bacterium]
MQQTAVQPQSKQKLSARNIIGYALGDTGGVLAFGVISSFLNMYYTDVFGINAAQIAILFLVARVWDAINDPVMGSILDHLKPRKTGRFRPWIYFFSFPMMLSLVLLFLPVYDWFNMSTTQLLIYAYITYIFYGMMYTGVNIPYGSMATVMTTDIKERSTLSMARTVGAGIGQMAGSVIFPLFVYTVADNGAKYLNGHKLFAGILVIVGFQFVAYQLNYRLTRETVIPPAKKKGESSVGKTLKSLLKNRPFITLSLASMLLIAGNMFTNTANGYLLKNYYETPGLQSLVPIATYLPMALSIPFLNKLVMKFGKKELCGFGAFISAGAYLVMFLWKIPNPYIFMAFLFLTGIGLSFFTMEVWAIVSDAIDYQDKLTGRREEGTSYAIFSFFRKMGQTVAGVGFNALLGYIGYVSAESGTGEVIQQSESTINGIYILATLVPFILYLIMALLMQFGYNIKKDDAVKLKEYLEERNAKRDAENAANSDSNSES